MRLCFIFIGALYGFFGIAVGMVLYGLYLGRIKTFGVPFLAPVFKLRSRSMTSPLILNNIERRERHPGYLKTKKSEAQPRISRRWNVKNKEK